MSPTDASSKAEENKTLLEASCAFTSAIKEGPDYVCVCCNRLMYHKTVVEFQMSRYDKAPSNFVVPESISPCDKQWICKTCHNALKRGLLYLLRPKLTIWTLHDDVPVELSDLNPLEIRLISLRIPKYYLILLNGHPMIYPNLPYSSHHHSLCTIEMV